MIKQETIQQVLEAVQIEQVVGDFVELKKRGTSLIGLCPFHNEKTPSFHVSVSKGIYKCFGCSEGGDSVRFIMELEKYSYPEAIRYLAEKYQIPVQETIESAEASGEKDHRESLMIVTHWANAFFQKNLWESEEGTSIGLSYFRERGYRDDVIRKFELGYSSQEWSDVYDSAVVAGYKEDFLVETGLVVKKDNGGLYDRFRGRVMFPIHNLTGRPLGFGGRILKKDTKAPKYVNSTESAIYHKSDVLYGLFQAKKAISQANLCYLVEGYADVIAMHQAGTENVVASSGTSLTQGQVRLVARYTKNVTILYDGDQAGIQAALRGTDLLLQEGINVRVVLFPDENDPDSYIRHFGASQFTQYLSENAEDFIFFKTKILLGQNGHDPIRKSETIRDVVESIALIPDELKVSVFIKDCSTLLDIEERVLLVELNRIRGKNIKRGQGTESQNSGTADPAQALPSEQSVERADPLQSLMRQEEEFVRVLLHYGNEIATWDEHKGIPVAPLLVNSIASMPFEGAITKEIIKIYQGFLQKEEIPDIKTFTSHSHKAVADLCISLLAEKYTLSENWNDDKRKIHVSHESDKLKELVISQIVRLSKRWLEQKINITRDQLRNANEYDTEILLKQYELYKMQLRKAGEELGTIILK